MLAVEFKKLINQIGIPTSWPDIRSAYRYNAPEEKFRAFEEEVLNFIRQVNSYEGIVNLIVKHEDIFDKELYILRVARLLEADVNMEKSIFANQSDTSRIRLENRNANKQQALQIAKRALKKVDIVDIMMTKKRIDIYSSQEFIGNKNFFDRKKEASAASLQRIEETIGLENVLGYIKPSDLIHCCRYPNLGNALAVKIIDNGVEIQGSDYTFEDKEMTELESLKKAETTPSKAFKWEDFYKTVREYSQYMNFDKILLLANAVFYNKYADKLENFTQEEALELKKFTETVGILLENKKITIDSPRFNRIISYSEINEWVTTLNKHYIGGVFHSDEEITQLANDIVNGKVDPSTLTKEEFIETMRFSVEEIGFIIENSPSSLEFLIENGYVSLEDAKKAIDTQEEMLDEELLYAYKSGIIDNPKISQLFENEVININSMRMLKENEIEERPLESVVSSKKLIDLYFDKEKREEFEEYRRLYKMFKIEGKSIEEQKEVADSLIEESIDLLEEDKIYDLYHMGLIPVDTAIEFVGQTALTKAFASGELKPADSKRLYDSGVITIQMIREVLKDQSIEDGQKLVLIYSTFPNREDVKTRTKLIEYLNDAAENFRNAGKGPKKKKDNDRIVDPVPQNKFVSDPCSRWKLISSIDEEYSQEYLKDGHIIFYLPNEEKYIIEKLYDKNNKPAYGAATYILDERTFEQNRDEIIKDEKIDKSALVELRKTQGKTVKKLIHTGWGNALINYFDIKESKKYTKEQCRTIQKLVEEVESSKKPLEER